MASGASVAISRLRRQKDTRRSSKLINDDTIRAAKNMRNIKPECSKCYNMKFIEKNFKFMTG